VFDECKDAVRDIDNLNVTNANSAISALAGASRQLAQTRLNEAIVGGGDAGDIASALADISKAEAALAEGKPDEAIDHYGKAWKHANDALL
jgi:hypothetical protein